MKLVLGTNSFLRQTLMKEAGYKFEIRTSDIDETPFMNPPPERACLYAAMAKSNAIGLKADEVLLTADTVVWHNGRILGKPKDEADAVQTLMSYGGRWAEVHTGIVVRRNSKTKSHAEKTKFKFRKISEEEAKAYVDTGIPMKFAGSFCFRKYSINFLEAVEGDFYNIEGLPMTKVFSFLKEFGVFPDPKNVA